MTSQPVDTQERAVIAADPPKANRFPLIVCLIFSILCLFTALWVWHDIPSRINALREEVAHQVLTNAELGNDNQAIITSLTNQVEALKETIRRHESQYNDIRDQQATLADMYKGVMRLEDRRILSDIEHLLMVANQELQLSSNVTAAINALETADMMLAQADNQARYLNLRRAFAEDLAQLKAVPEIDVNGTVIKIDQTIKNIDILPMLSVALNPIQKDEASPQEFQQRAKNWRDMLRSVWDEVRQLISVRQIAHENSVFLYPDQAYFIRENLKLRLLTARAALLWRNDEAYHQNLNEVLLILRESHYFDQGTQLTQTTLRNVEELNERHPVVEVPSLTKSYMALKEVTPDIISPAQGVTSISPAPLPASSSPERGNR